MANSRSAPPGPDERMDVLWLIKGLGPGGAERLLVLNARFRDRSRFRCRAAYLLAWKDAMVPAVEAEGVGTECYRAQSSWDPRWVLRLRRSLSATPVDLVHVHSPLVALGARLIVRTMPAGRRPRLVTTEHSLWQSHGRLVTWANIATFGLDDAHLAVSEAVRSSLPARLRGRMEVLPHGVDTDDVRSQSGHRREVRRELGIGEDEVVIGTVANLRVMKAYPDLLTAARRVLDEVPGVRFVSMGQGPLQQEISRLHGRLAFGDRFLMLGYRDDPVRVMSAFDVYCLASHHEGLPVSLMEAMVLGLAVVATDVGGVPEVVTDGHDGLLVPPGRPDRLADVLVGLAVDPARRAELAANAIERAEQLSVARVVERTEDLYREVLAR